ncbi:MAG: molybdopterin-binding/glycosyltransferase family 2 protein [Rhodospirillaceae bacterium]|nr:molybdopterin-binding/glycosyltransferase family 2 protein [Rhodospirillaceae bacterium]
MEFGERFVRQAEGALLAHSVAVGKRRFRKGHKLTADDVAAFLAAGIERAIVALLGPEDVPENEAAQLLAEALAGTGLKPGLAGTGRCSLYPERPGLLQIAIDEVHRFNAVHEAITLATVAPFDTVAPGRIAATVKIIPFAAPRDAVERCREIAREPILHLAPFRTLRVALIQTSLPGLKPSLLADTVEVTRGKLAAMGCDLVAHADSAHARDPLAARLAEILTQRPDAVLVLGASAIIDRRDVVPSAIEAQGGTLIHFGMPVDPGNLTLLARIGAVHVIGLPGSARSPRLHGSDYVLQRLAAGIDVSGADIMRMGVGGLLKEIPSRPMPRARAAKAPPKPPVVAAIILAAGRSTRMGEANKLLADIDGVPLVRRVVAAVLEGGPATAFVVTGHQGDRVAAAMAGLPVRLVANPDYAQGMSTSLKAGIAALPPGTEAALICLGDMPGVDAALVRRLIGAFAPKQGKDIVIPARQGRRGNPVLIGARHFSAIMQVSGDVGARDVVKNNAESVVEIPVEGDAAFVDLDTPEALAEYRARAAAASDCGRH